MNQFRIYLKSELRKLGNEGDANDLLGKVEKTKLAALGIPTDVCTLNNLFCSQKVVNDYVQGLADNTLRELTQLCSEWRKNNVYDKLDNYFDWQEATVEVSRIFVQQAESHLAEIFKCDSGKLSSIVLNPELWRNRPYSEYRHGTIIEFPTCIAIRHDSDKYKLFDGIHRAIQMAYQGIKSINLCYADISDKRDREVTGGGNRERVLI